MINIASRVVKKCKTIFPLYYIANMHLQGFLGKIKVIFPTRKYFPVGHYHDAQKTYMASRQGNR